MIDIDHKAQTTLDLILLSPSYTLYHVDVSKISAPLMEYQSDIPCTSDLAIANSLSP